MFIMVPCQVLSFSRACYCMVVLTKIYLYLITEETMRAKQMLATMSHEIRSPLSGVISMASILARTPLNEDQKLKVDFMIKSGNDVLELINDILDLSKVEAGML
jgi:signal transduction histidine kinase